MSKLCATCHTNNIKHPTMGICGNCYQSMLYWGKKSPKQMMDRLKNLSTYEARMNAMIPINVVYKKPKAVALDVLPGQYKKRFKRKQKQVKQKLVAVG